MKKQIITSILLVCISIIHLQAKNITLSSPDKRIELTVKSSKNIQFQVLFNGVVVVEKGIISLNLPDKILGANPVIQNISRSSVKDIINPIIPLKSKSITGEYNRVLISYKKNFQIEFRAFNNGIAYRFITSFKDSIRVENEQVNFVFPENYEVFKSKTEPHFSNYEHVYKRSSLQALSADSLAIVPMFLKSTATRILLAEADVFDYPAMLLKGGKGNSISAWFPAYPVKTEAVKNSWWSDRRVNIVKEGDFIAKTKGKRAFPWRIIAIAKEDKGIAANQLVYILSRPCKSTDTEWIKPGQTSWEWWHASNIIGVDFKSGLNTKTYKYYIDFAAHYGMSYMLLDEGWSKSVLDIMEANPDIDLEGLIAYGKKKNVRLILWASWLAVENTPGFFNKISKMGIAGVKIDFMDRSDQWMMNFYERTAQRAFKNHLLVDFHGSVTPRGLNRTYPNVLSFEGVTGMEQNKSGGFDLPVNHTILPFTRNVVGPMDYTPGAMKSVHPEYWNANWTNPMSISTRAHQLALYIVFESALQMLADNPSDYYKEDECTRFITSVPTVWDETIVLDGEIGEYYVVAKRKADKWFVAGVTNENARNITIDFSFLNDGKIYKLSLFKDGVNSDKYAIDYKKLITDVKKGQNISIQMNKDGGFASVLE